MSEKATWKATDLQGMLPWLGLAVPEASPWARTQLPLWHWSRCQSESRDRNRSDPCLWSDEESTYHRFVHGDIPNRPWRECAWDRIKVQNLWTPHTEVFPGTWGHPQDPPVKWSSSREQNTLRQPPTFESHVNLSTAKRKCGHVVKPSLNKTLQGILDSDSKRAGFLSSLPHFNPC